MSEEEKPEFKETPIYRHDITALLNNTKKLATMYSELLEKKREGWERVLKAKLKRETREDEGEDEEWNDGR